MKVILLTEGVAPDLFPGADCVVVKTLAELESHGGADLYVDLDFRFEESRVSVLSRMLPSMVMVNAVVDTITEIGHRFIRINGWPGMPERTVHELAVPDAAMAAQVEQLYAPKGFGFRMVPDIPGMVTARILAAIINEAWYTWEAGVSSKEEIDTAMRLGTNYPMGPFEWGERIGLYRIVELLDVLSRTDRRYIPADSLKKACDSIKI